MYDRARPMSQYRVFSLIAATVVAAVAFSSAAYADDDSGSPDQPSIVVGGTVHPPTVIVVDPQTPVAATGPINPAKPIAVDPRVRGHVFVASTKAGVSSRAELSALVWQLHDLGADPGSTLIST
jgi:hypothetical protein